MVALWFFGMAINMTLKNIPEDLYLRLKESAGLEHRSLNGQAITCLERVLKPQRRPLKEVMHHACALRSRHESFQLTRDEIQRAIREGRA